MSIMIDKSISYIESKNAYYLAKEGLVVHYTSLTGRKSDQVWIKHSMSETIRIIKATRLSAGVELKEGHVLSAFQELSRVFEFGTRSRHTVEEGIFNYYTHSNLDMTSQVASGMADAFIMRGFLALLGNDVTELFQILLKKLDCFNNSLVERDSLLHIMDVSGYTYRSKSKRVVYMGNKVNAYMSHNSTPSQITQITSEISEQIIKQVYGELK